MVKKTLQNLWQELGCHPHDNKSSIIEAWRKLDPAFQTSELQLFVKALLDPYYRAFIERYESLDQLLPAGFFDDKHAVGQLEYHLDFFTTPLHKIIHQIELIQSISDDIDNKPYVVILNTGSYSPIHIGHLQMMEEAKRVLSKHYHVVGGYFSPSHDSYVSQKYSGTASYHADSRISLCEEVISDSDWLMIDPWEARYNDRAINFTDVIIRLKQYFKKHISTPISLAYVFGSDNAGFSWAFLEEDISVCFERPGYHSQFESIKLDPLLQNDRHFFIPSQNNAYSSKAIREGNYEFLPEKIKHLYFLYQNNRFPVQTPIYLLRDDRTFAISNFPSSIQGVKLNQAVDKLYQSLKESIKVAFNDYCHMQVLSLSTEQQNQYLNMLEGNIINLDGCTSHPYQYLVGVSRLFYLSDGQVFSPQLISRLGYPDLAEQIKNIPAGSYQLVDDDIASGKTMKLIKNLLPDNIKISEYIALSRQSFYGYFDYELSYQFHDIVDLRDFIIGSYDGGLVVELPNKQIGRVPYIWPYVSLSHRAKIPHQSQLSFSLAVWEMNFQFYSSLPMSLSIQEMSPHFQVVAIYLGFKKTDKMVDFCQFHLQKLQHLNGLK